MARYSANEQSSYESGGSVGFRLEKDNDKARVIFLYDGPESIDGWACHRFQIGTRGYTVTVDCPRQAKDSLDKCPACKDGQVLYTRLFVRMLNLDKNKVEIWDRASGFRTELLGQMSYYNPLYSRVYEITRHGTGLQTRYQLQPLNDSNLTPEQYTEMVKQADELTEEYIKPIDSYQSVLGRINAAKKQEAEEGVTVNSSPAQGAWGQPPQSPSPQNQAPNYPNSQQWGQAPQAPQGNWGQPPQGFQNQQGQTSQPQNGNANSQTPPWGIPPQGFPNSNQ